MQDPFAVLGLPPTATLAEVRAARRRLAMTLHPDHGGDPDRMREVNRAFDLAVKALLRPDADAAAGGTGATARPEPAGGTSSSRPGRVADDGPDRSPGRGAEPGAHRVHYVNRRMQHDSPSFSIELLPAEAFEALLVVGNWIGDVLVDDPPYLLDLHLREPAECWCRLELLPEAGGSMVSITVAGLDDAEAPPIDDVRDVLVAELNQLSR